MVCERQAPAKINLGLFIKGRRPDGYHDLETVFYPVALHDTLRLTLTPEAPATTLTVEGHDDLGPAEANLCYKAWALMREQADIPPVHIQLIKRIPTGAGLGGGSSDAAAVLLALNNLCNLQLPDTQLAALAVRLGADVPFFLRQRPMLAQGVGDVLTPIALHLPYDIRLVTPPIHSDTKAAYQGLTPADFSPGADLAQLIHRPVSEWRHVLRNDFECSVFARYPLLATLKQELYDAGAVYASMTGSGSALYGLFPQPGA